MALIPVVNEQDEIIGYKERAEIQKEDIYRVTALRITNSKGEILIAQRALTKKNNPGTRWPAVSGTVEKGETYDENIEKEMYEELWLETIEITPRIHERKSNTHDFFLQRYRAEVDEPISYFSFPEEETAAIKRISKEELLTQTQQHPEQFVPDMGEYIQRSL